MIQTFPDAPYPPRYLKKQDLPTICVVTGECVGLFRNGGLGTSMTGMAEMLAAHGFQVTILYTGEIDGPTKPWIEKYRSAGIELLVLEEANVATVSGPLASCNWTAAYRVYEILRTRHFDVIHFNDTTGEALYCVTAKRLGLGFADSLLCLALHSPTQWILELNGTPADWIGFTCFSQAERDAVAATDLLWGPSRYLLEWTKDNEFQWPSQTFNQQYVVPTTRLFEPGTEKLALKERPSDDSQTVPPEEIVFFGRLEERKGIRVFCNAITQIGEEIAVTGAKVVFMGKPSTINGSPSLDFLNEKSKAWPFEWELISDFDQQRSLAYLSKSKCVSVMPSPFDNSPCTVYEALQNQIPFIAAHRGGIPELIHDDDKDATLFKYTTDDLAQKLSGILKHGLRPARPPIPIDANRGRWIGMHLDWRKYRDAATPIAARATDQKIALLVDHAGTPADIDVTLKSVRLALGDGLAKIAVILRDQATMADQDADLVVRDHGYSDTQEIQKWLVESSELATLCLRSGVTLKKEAKQVFQSVLGQNGWDALLVTAEMHNGAKTSLMPMIASPAFLYFEDKFDTGAALFHRRALEKYATAEALISEQPWCGLVDCLATSGARMWPLAEPLVDITPAAAVVWRGEHVQRSMRYTKMMAHDKHFAMAIGRKAYQTVFPPDLALSSKPDRNKQVKRAVIMSVTNPKGFVRAVWLRLAWRTKAYAYLMWRVPYVLITDPKKFAHAIRSRLPGYSDNRTAVPSEKTNSQVKPVRPTFEAMKPATGNAAARVLGTGSLKYGSVRHVIGKRGNPKFEHAPYDLKPKDKAGDIISK